MEETQLVLCSGMCVCVCFRTTDMDMSEATSKVCHFLVCSVTKIETVDCGAGFPSGEMKQKAQSLLYMSYSLDSKTHSHST